LLDGYFFVPPLSLPDSRIPSFTNWLLEGEQGTDKDGGGEEPRDRRTEGGARKDKGRPWKGREEAKKRKKD
jgi:hypothetical protein